MGTATSRVLGGSHTAHTANPWNALWAMMIGFFMIMLDSTIVSIANPTIMAALHVGYAQVIWVTSAYLLGYAVVLLVAGRLGDRFGPKNLYLFGLVVFTVASMWCGLSGTAAMLIAARAVQGVGAGILTPQTLSTITRTFSIDRRGAALSVWGTAAGVASLVGPLIGGVLVDWLGWEWIFFVNIPIGVIGLALAAWLVPVLPVAEQRFDLFGVAVSGAGMFLLVFGLQEGQSAGWAPWIWAILVAGVGCMAMFIYWQSVNQRAPLIPLKIFRDRDFSLCSIGVAITAFATTAMMLPLTFYAQSAYGLSPTRAALLIAPMAVTSGALAPLVGIIVDRVHPVPVLGFGFSALTVSMTWLSIEMSPDTPVWRLVLPFGLVGVGMAFVWSPLAATATRYLPPDQAGAGSGVYNATRQLGAVLGSASMAAFMTSRIGAVMPPPPGGATEISVEGAGLQLPGLVRAPFSAAMSQSLLLPAFVALLGIVAALFLVAAGRSVAAGADHSDYGDYGYDDDDDYLEYILVREPDAGPTAESDNRRVGTGPRRPRAAAAEAWTHEPLDAEHSRLPDFVSQAGPSGAVHNGAHCNDEQRFRSIAGRHPESDDTASHRRHSCG
ncbi:Spectinomycin tetracycline efflux pump [Mycobacterium basiliense]|uniref:Spectinomycin tetracycline efflux pump n=1 Tax=Mycobacterium basiliense TaxID=2094119 RepID=A0A447GHU1_9MYCO|nr:MFS transporter [Mycobacterium basiliense]VDM90061.1 Spectinomycin tetracycline efflux pump [Mycobacterium basiliense]